LIVHNHGHTHDKHCDAQTNKVKCNINGISTNN
jgi:hypothetical protein